MIRAGALAPARSPQLTGRGDARQLSFPWTGMRGGQAVVVARWLDSARQARYMVVTTTLRGARITGITCTTGGNGVSQAGAIHTAASLYRTYEAARHAGISSRDVLAQLLSGGPTSGSSYLRQVQSASARSPLGYDPVLCRPAGLPGVTVSSATIVSGGSAGLVVIRPQHGASILAVVTLGAQGWNVTDIACRQPRP